MAQGEKKGTCSMHLGAGVPSTLKNPDPEGKAGANSGKGCLEVLLAPDLQSPGRDGSDLSVHPHLG